MTTYKIFGVTGEDPIQLTLVAGTTPQIDPGARKVRTLAPVPVQIANLAAALPASTTSANGVAKKAASVTALGTGGTSTIAQIETAVNAIIANLKSAGLMA